MNDFQLEKKTLDSSDKLKIFVRIRLKIDLQLYRNIIWAYTGGVKSFTNHIKNIQII